ncbi:uncharacterized protein LOC128677265 [Plodia interpunctella]|uniref:uncharacterized protein LOC128677265 n=1 Tax=Plodia interpunctella TaxID=58824 RepID=UPI0023676BA2|nr:uncharacterized protein LOC128677265 [Plodia interpunctella]
MKLFLYIFFTHMFIAPSRSYKGVQYSIFEEKQDEERRHPLKPITRKPLLKAGGAFNIIRSYGVATEDKGRSRLDPVLNFVNARKSSDKKEKGKKDESAPASSSSSLELRDWKDEWREHWIVKKFEAINNTDFQPGDTVNMAAARPWGVPCGDPGQHDMPWGTCMLPMECDSEYRIYRGDFNCGRTQFVCCALQLTVYDMYQGFDLSFEDSALRTDSDEKKAGGKKGSAEDNKKTKKRDKRKRQAARKKRKREIKRLIRKIQKEIRRIINKQDRNASQQRKRKTKQLKKFIEMLKAQYRHDRKAVQDIHEHEMVKIDDALKVRLHEISMMNQNFVNNATFRDIVVNGTLNRQSARMLVEAYPELQPYVHVNVRRRSGVSRPVRDYLDYDVEYGMLYY